MCVASNDGDVRKSRRLGLATRKSKPSIAYTSFPSKTDTFSNSKTRDIPTNDPHDLIYIAMGS